MIHPPEPLQPALPPPVVSSIGDEAFISGGLSALGVDLETQRLGCSHVNTLGVESRRKDSLGYQEIHISCFILEEDLLFPPRSSLAVTHLTGGRKLSASRSDWRN